MIHTHVLNRGPAAVRSPLDGLTSEQAVRVPGPNLVGTLLRDIRRVLAG